MPDYLVTIAVTPDGMEAVTQTRLVNAKNQARAINHIWNSVTMCEKATTAQILDCGTRGIQLETASDE